jgi:hypothetical protein
MCRSTWFDDLVCPLTDQFLYTSFMIPFLSFSGDGRLEILTKGVILVIVARQSIFQDWLLSSHLIPCRTLDEAHGIPSTQRGVLRMHHVSISLFHVRMWCCEAEASESWGA